MAEKNFFDLLKEKMAALRPSVRHREEDWAALTARLDQALPQPPRDRRRAWVPLLLLLLALLSSNALWWRESRENRIAMRRVEVQLAGLQTSVSSLKPVPPIVRTDTVWRTVYIQMPNRQQFEAPLLGKRSEVVANNSPSIDRENALDTKKTTPQPSSNDYDYSVQQKNMVIGSQEQHSGASDVNLNQSGDSTLEKTPAAKIATLQMSKTPLSTFVKSSTQRTTFDSDVAFIPEIKPYKPTRPFGPLLLNALKPKYVKVGAIAGWLNPLSPALMHQVGFEVGAQSSIGFSRHWSLILEYTYGQLHYESSKPSAILGTPEFPTPPSSDHHFAHLDVKRQPLRQFGLGLRYTFSEWGKTRPYIGLNWGNQTLLPFTVEYEVQHEPSGTIQPSILTVDKTTRLRNTIRLGLGLEVPLSRRFDLTVEGFYLHQWKKKYKDTLNPMGLRVGVNWAF